MNNSGVNVVPGGPVNPFAGAENISNPNTPMTPEAMQKMQEQMMQQMQKMQEMQNKLMQMQGNNVFQQNGISVQNRSENMNTNLKHEQDVVLRESVDSNSNLGAEKQDMHAAAFGEKNDGASAEKIITDEEIDAPVENSPLEKEMAALEKTKAEAEKKEAEAEGDPDFKAIDEAAEAANIQRDTENYKFVKNVVKSLDPKNPAQMSKNLNHARWAYMERIFNRKLGDGLSGKAA